MFRLLALLYSALFISLALGVSSSAAQTQKKEAVKKETKTETSKKTKYKKTPAGNRNKRQPKIPGGSAKRTKEAKTSFENKYNKIRDLIKSDKKLQTAIKKSSKKFDIEPIHIIGALVGEHTYNVDALDRIQTYLVKAASYFDSAISFQYDGEHVLKFVKRKEFEKCKELKDSYQLWDCREEVWVAKFYGKEVDGKKWPKNRFGAVFFQPLYAGQTFGLGQINPLTALRVNDLVKKKARGASLSANKAPQVYKVIMNPTTSIDYIAAVLKTSIDAYRQVANVDISSNPGVTATLYNLGDVYDRAAALAKKRKRSSKVWPKENYYGWLVNDKLDELSTLIK
ncbi:MAG: DUF1402 family protein [Nitratireductor sp.]